MRKMIGAVAFILMMVVGNGGWATQVLPKSADDLAHDADVVFVGTCLTRDVKAGPPVATEYTFKIETAVKGPVQAGSTFTFRQWGALPGTVLPKGLSAPRLLGLPNYEVGRKVMLFLGPVSSAGFRTPIGLGQGVFTVLQAEDGSTIIQNEMGNRFLFPTESGSGATGPKAVGAPPRPAGQLHLNDFLQTIRKAGGQS